MLKGIILALKNIEKNPCKDTGLSASNYPYLEDFLLQIKHAGLPVHLAKPDEDFSSDCITSGKDRFGILPEECLLITNSDSVARAAQIAHIPCLGYLPPEMETDRLSACHSLFESFANLDLAYLQRVHAHACSYPAPILSTPRLFIREFSQEDFPVLYEMCATTDESSYLKHPLGSYETERIKHEAYIKNVYPFFDLALWGIYNKQSGDLIGHAGFSLTGDDTVPFAIGYFIAASYRRKGYATECVPHLLSYAKEQGYSTISAKIGRNNIASQNVIRHCGYPYDILHEEKETISYLIHLKF